MVDGAQFDNSQRVGHYPMQLTLFRPVKSPVGGSSVPRCMSESGMDKKDKLEIDLL